MKYPAFSIDTDTVRLSDSPLDDYQRLYLVSVLDRNSPPASFSAGLGIKKANYKSSIAAQFTHPNFIVRPRDATDDADEDAVAAAAAGGRPPQNVLNCFEYQFPNLQTIQSSHHEQALFAQLSNSNAAAAATASHPPLHLHAKNVLMGKDHTGLPHQQDSHVCVARQAGKEVAVGGFARERPLVVDEEPAVQADQDGP